MLAVRCIQCPEKVLYLLCKSFVNQQAKIFLIRTQDSRTKVLNGDVISCLSPCKVRDTRLAILLEMADMILLRRFRKRICLMRLLTDAPIN